MLDIKLTVLFTIVVFSSCLNNYCDICRNHTLCLFIETGLSTACKSYDDSAILTRVEIKEMVNRINERRNYIAMGLSKILPQAANMNKILWSSELAASAQRWVDQCDQSIHPDKEDHCRDLGYTEVGQNIASVLGPTSGLHVKSFIDMWYIEILNYKGDVTYYNQSQHHNTHYFTQLIWAETNSVGCGKARFYIETKNTTVERLVCNFAPKGNIHGKPIYNIGYPSTQCSYNMIPDSKYTALCIKRYNSTARNFTTHPSHVSSLLRILNLSNSSVKQDIDPIRNNLKQINNSSCKSKDQRNQKIRHVYFNHSYGYIKRVSPLRKQNFWNPSTNVSFIYHNQQEKEHSRVYHGYELQGHNPVTGDENSNQNFRTYGFTTNSLKSHYLNDHRKFGILIHQCTRRMKSPKNNYAIDECNIPSCTRGEKNDNFHQFTTTCHSSNLRHELCLMPNCNSMNELCPCNKRSTCYTTPTRCSCDTNGRRLNVGITPYCSDPLRIKDSISKSQEDKFYDLPVPLIVRSGNEKLPTSDSPPNRQQNYNKMAKKVSSRTEYDEYHEQVKKSNVHRQLYDRNRDYLYENFDSSERSKRGLEERIPFRPLWELDQYNHKMPSELKSIKYTTLHHKTRRNTKRPPATSKPKIITESITITLKNTPVSRGIKDHISEKYLSFDELLRLRKFTADETYQNARRKASGDNLAREGQYTSSPTTEITTNTPFVRKKHCTRKLTCTWTALTMSDGKIIAGGAGFDVGSRTPPGYVDGCTRTSTCTREFMDRNKMSTLPDNTSSEVTPEDEDYCERRALNVQRRNLENKIFTNSTIDYKETFYTEHTTLPTEMTHNTISALQLEKEMFIPQYGCVCNHESSRIKRNDYVKNKHIDIKDYQDSGIGFKNKITFSKIRSTQSSNCLVPNTCESICTCGCAGLSIEYCIILFILILLI